MLNNHKMKDHYVKKKTTKKLKINYNKLNVQYSMNAKDDRL